LYYGGVASLTIRHLPENVKARLKKRAKENRRSMEEEAREILTGALAKQPEPNNMAEAIRSIFEPLGGFELPEIRREPIGEPIKFD
jgi:antitoxin FitA